MLQACITCRQNARCCITVSRCSIYRSTPWRRRASDRCRQRTKRVYSCKPHNTRRACKPHNIRRACKPHTRQACRLRIRRSCRPRIRPVCRPRTKPACRRTRPACSCRRGRCARTTRATRRPPPTARPERRTAHTRVTRAGIRPYPSI